jgi:hypothetical protein
MGDFRVLVVRNQRGGKDFDAGMRFELNALHPENGSLPVEDGPESALGA